MKKITNVPQNINMFLEDLRIQNYHKHTSYSNTVTPDSGAINKEYAERAIEVNSSILTSGEHGNQGNYWETYDLAKEYNLKFIFSTEAYWVKNRIEKDSTNSHIVLLAKNENGRLALNDALSEANISGYYFKPRLDLELILALPKDDVFVTSACIAFWLYDDIEDIIVQLHNHFGENFMLEVQYHNTEKQKKLNKRMIDLSKKLGIELICGLDSHYIHQEESSDREFILEYKHIKYPEEDGFYMDYPDVKTIYSRFKEQGVLSDIQILNAINNTNITLEFDDIELDNSIKLPNLLEGKSQEERNDYYKQLLNEGWMRERENIPKELHSKYIEEIQKEAQVVINTNMADYFIDDYFLVKEAKARGGLLTPTGRGSGVSFYTNKLLGFTDVDRISAPVKMYPERFMSEARILETKSLPDLDLNWGNPEIAEEAQTAIFGEGHSYPMIAYGTLQKKSAFKLYAGANHVDFEISNHISKQIDDYEKDLKYAEDDEKDFINLYDYVDKKYHYLLDDSEKYMGIIMDKKRHPCGHLIYDGDIRREVGLIKVKSVTTGKEYICAMIDGGMADKYGFVKNDLLKVDVVNTIKKTYEQIGIEIPTIKQLNEILKNSKEMQRVYHEGITMGINQFEKEGTRLKSTRYRPKNISEITAFVAGIRPSFKSMYSVFENRKSFQYGINTFDNLIKTEEMPDSFLLYQEQLMSALAYSGIPMDETMTLIKAISKKKKKVIVGYEGRFLNGFAEKIIKDEGCSKEVAEESAKKVWQIIYDSARYGFNASHAYCVANDSLYGAHLKSHYPYDFYESVLNIYLDKKDKNKIALFKQEMTKFYGIESGKFRFRLDNRAFVKDVENSTIYPALSSIKNMGQNVAEELFEMKDNKYNSFLDMIPDLIESSIKKNQVEILIRLNYFEEFGKPKKLLKIYKMYENIGTAKQISKGKFDETTESVIEKYSRQTTKQFRDLDNYAIMNELISSIKNEDFPISEILNNEVENLGYAEYVNEEIEPKYACVVKKTHKGKHPVFDLYRINNGTIETVKVKIQHYLKSEFDVGNILLAEDKHIKMEGRWKTSPEKVNEKNKKGFYQDETDKEAILNYYKVVK